MGKKEKKKYALLVDGFDQIREVTRSVLEGAGYQVTAVSNIGDALKALAGKKPDIIICEVELSGMGGIGFYHRLKKNKETYKIPFVFLTGYDPKKLETEIKAGDILIAKPVQWKNFIEQINRFMQRRLAPSPAKTADKKPPGATEKPVARQKSPEVKLLVKQGEVSREKAGETGQVAPKKASGTGTGTGTKKTSLTQAEADRAAHKELRINTSHRPMQKRKKRKIPSATLPPGKSTQHFSNPTGMFDSKNVRSATDSLFKSAKNGEIQEIAPTEFPVLEIPIQGLKETLISNRTERTRRVDETKETEEDVFVDFDEFCQVGEDGEEGTGSGDFLMEFEDETYDDSEDEFKQEFDEQEAEAENEFEEKKEGAEEEETEESLRSHDQKMDTVEEPAEKLEEISGEAPKTSDTEGPDTMAEEKKEEAFFSKDRWPQACDFSMPTSMSLIYSLGKVVPSSAAEEEKVEEISHTIWSMAGLCLQMFGRDYDIEYVSVATEQEDIFLFQERELFSLIAGKGARLTKSDEKR